jgi:hypothetical protein
MQAQIEHNSRIDYALNLSADILLKLLDHEECLSDPNVAIKAVQLALSMVTSFEQSGIMNPHHETPEQRYASAY